MIDSNISSLRAEFQPLVRLWLDTMQLDILTRRWPGHKVRIMETLRSLVRQDQVNTSGASTLKVGMHNFGLAFDWGAFGPTGEYFQDDRTGIYLAGGFVGMALGMRWGGNWDQDKNIAEPGESDMGHLEWHPGGVTLAQLKADAGIA